MKHLFYSGIALFVMLLISASDTDAQKTRDGSEVADKASAQFINRTSEILYNVNNTVQKEKVYTGYLTRAATYQHEAIKDFRSNQAASAIQKSYDARRLSFLALSANKGFVPIGWRLNKKEAELVDRLVPNPKNDYTLRQEATSADKNAEKNLVLNFDKLSPNEGGKTEDEKRGKRQDK